MESKLTQIVLSYNGLEKVFEYLRKGENGRYVQLNYDNPIFNVDMHISGSTSEDYITRLSDIMKIIEGKKTPVLSLDSPIENLGLGTRITRSYETNNIKTVGDLTRLTEKDLKAMNGIGKQAVRMARYKLSEYGLKLREADLPTYDPVILSKPIDRTEWSSRSKKAFDKIGAKTIGDLAMLTEKQLSGVRNFGMTSLIEVRRKLKEFGLKLKEE